MSECDYGCGQEAEHEQSNGKMCCSEHYSACPAVRTKVSEGVKAAYERGDKDTKHLDGHRGWNKGKTFNVGEYGKKTISDTVKKGNIKKKLIRRRGYKCQGCEEAFHRDEKIPLEIHRIDETKSYEESEADNFKLLCPNCHAQADNYRGQKASPPGKKVNEKDLAEALREKDSIRQALLSVGLAGKGANYDRAKKVARKHDIGV